MTAPRRVSPRRSRSHLEVPAAVGVFVVVLLSLQVFLLTVGVDALLAGDAAWRGSPLPSPPSWPPVPAFHRYLR